MPLKIICGQCKSTLYYGDEILNPIEILLNYNSKCPNCGKKLTYDYDKIKMQLIGFSTRDKYCIKCGTLLPSDPPRFCDRCGMKIGLLT